MKKKTSITTLILASILLCSCGGGNRQQAASDNEAATVETIENQEIVSREPAIIDIAGNLENRREFKLSDFGSSVRYIRLQSPPGVHFTRVLNMLSDDENIFINIAQGIFRYSADGEFLHPLFVNDYEVEDWGGFRINRGFFQNGDLLNGMLLYRAVEEGVGGTQLNLLDVSKLQFPPFSGSSITFPAMNREVQEQSAFQRQLPTDTDVGFFSARYLLIDEQSYLVTTSRPEPLTAISIQGDTLFTINNYHRPVITGRVAVAPSARFYRIDGNLMIQREYNDTVLALIPPNRVEPAFVMDWGAFRPDMNLHANGAVQEDKFILQNWVETQQHIFIEYTEGRVFPNRWNEGNVHHHWAIFDKEEKTLTHHFAPSGIPMRQVTSGGMSFQIPTLMFENDIDPVGMPFFPQGINHRGEMYMIFSKEQVRDQIATGKFDNSRLQTLYDRMPDGSFYLMTVN